MKKIFLISITSFSISSLCAQNWSETGDNHTTGKLGIGLTNPHYLLDIKGSGNNQDLLRLSHPTSPSAAGLIIGFGQNKDLIDNGSIDFKIEFSNVDYDILGINRVNRDFYYVGGGNVGIGTMSPEMKLDIDGSISLRGETNPTTGNAIVMGWSIDGDFARIRSRDWSSAQWKRLDFQASDYTFREGNVGIGVTSPDYLLDIKGTNNNQDLLRLSHPTSPTAAGLIVGFGKNKDLSDDGAIDFKVEFSSVDYSVLGINRHNRDFYYTGDGNVGIGTTDPQSKLAVEGQIRATEVKVLADISVPDYVFEPDYKLRTLKETKEYISEHKHLPEIPSAAEIGENGIDLGDMNMRLLKKVEELTLHLIEQNERVEKLEKEVSILKNK